MSDRPVEGIAAQMVRDTGLNVLESEMLAEKAASLGHHGRSVEKAIAGLKAFDPVSGRRRTGQLFSKGPLRRPGPFLCSASSAACATRRKSSGSTTSLPKYWFGLEHSKSARGST